MLLGGGAGLVGLLAAAHRQWRPLQALNQQIADGVTVLAPTNEILAKMLSGLTDFGGHTLLVRVLLLVTAYLLIRREVRLAAYVVVTIVGALILDPAFTLLIELLPPFPDARMSETAGPLLRRACPRFDRRLWGVAARLPAHRAPTPACSRRGRCRRARRGRRAYPNRAGGASPTDALAGWLLGAAWLAFLAPLYVALARVY